MTETMMTTMTVTMTETIRSGVTETTIVTTTMMIAGMGKIDAASFTGSSQ
jgi:hypothetical protein